jgi:hypothetical protein
MFRFSYFHCCSCNCPQGILLVRWSLPLNVECVSNVIAHPQKPDFVFRREGRVHSNRQGRQFSRLLTAEVYASAVVMLDTPCSKVVWRVLATHSICQFPLHFPSRASPCAIRFQLDSNTLEVNNKYYQSLMFIVYSVCNFIPYLQIFKIATNSIVNSFYLYGVSTLNSGHHQDLTQEHET